MISKVNTTFSRKLKFLALATSILVSTNVSWAKGEVSEVSISATPAISTTYLQGGTIYRWGAGTNTVLNGFTHQNQAFVYDAATVDRVEVLRVDNINASGVRCNLYVESINNEFVYSPSYPGNADESICDVRQMVSNNILNVKPLDVFTNAGSRPDSINNIERIDFITENGIATGLRPEQLQVSGVAVMEKAGNNALKLAAITSLDSNGVPNEYGALVQVNPSFGDANSIRYGMTRVEIPFHYLSNDLGNNPGNVVFRSAVRESIGLAFVSQQDLGLRTGQIYFGFSVFAADVDASHQLTNPAGFPRDTRPDNLGPGDADFSAASAFLASNNAPAAVDDSAVTSVSQPVTINILLNDNDPDGDTLIVTIISPPQNGAATIANNQLVYTPDSGFTGSDSITYQIDDGNGGRDSAVVGITVDSGNAAPNASDDLATTSAGVPVTLSVLDNDSDPDGDVLSITLLSQPENGSIVLNGDSMTYTPAAGFSGSDTFEYEINDGHGGRDSATVTVSITAVLSGTSGRIETGLNGHGAGSFDIIWLILLSMFGLLRVLTRNGKITFG